MNSRERRKLEALQHNDAIRYEKWLIDNTAHQERRNLARRQAGKHETRSAAARVILGIGAYYASQM